MDLIGLVCSTSTSEVNTAAFIAKLDTSLIPGSEAEANSIDGGSLVVDYTSPLL